MELPPVYNNTGVMNQYSAIFLVLLSAVLIGLNYFGVITISYWLALAPAIYLYVRTSVFKLLLNAFHRALQIDAAEADQANAAAYEMEVRNASTFDADKLLAALRDEDLVGRA